MKPECPLESMWIFLSEAVYEAGMLLKTGGRSSDEPNFESRKVNEDRAAIFSPV